MKYKFEIQGRLDALNEYTSANRQNYQAGGRMKRDNENLIIWSIRQHLKNLHIEKPVIIHYNFYEQNKKRDNDNILSCAAKFIQDSLVKAKVLQNDSQKFIHRFWFDTWTDQVNPRIEVEIYEIEREWLSYSLLEIIKLLEVGG
ncbi:Endodeoxyribonuclease RusA [Anaerosporobacter mobilis DSM 15930]|jgi:Holliday junction resolvase RusA-like endonuclease|uniref:Endodeoxyribonuclease RusA n=1 Tax=Anaerosporobacter mobilis DSM 15930 TaxID=1120996 RepID=A0A1M7NHN2_9FIRM|nr:RusA family crossover junction endodeoxyribonuclease [Anaerosporobacter mobilis]SHN03241.1 Endodeoxyribonuclease RusA [Anaerosporobacter mobilis DSM 15930]